MVDLALNTSLLTYFLPLLSRQLVPNANLSTHTVYQYKIQFFHYFGRLWPYWKMDTGKHNIHEILLLF